jgi:L-threonylcarbamoyladenylate synthase
MERVGTGAADLARAAAAIAAGRLVAYPTETFYGLAADPWQPAALARLLDLKGRPAGAPLPVILAHRDHLAALVDRIPDAARALMDRHWPGPLTLVLPARPGLPAPLLSAWGVGVRVTPHPVAAGLATRLAGPLVATSANRRGAPPAQTADEVAAELPEVDLVVDGGSVAGGAPSTVVAVDAAGTLTILRAGAIHVC